MTDKDWLRIIRPVVTILALALASIPAALALGIDTQEHSKDSQEAQCGNRHGG